MIEVQTFGHPARDIDYDWVPDRYENDLEWRLFIGSVDTFNLDAVYPGICGDQEFTAFRSATEAPPAHDDDKDWSSEGKQYTP